MNNWLKQSHNQLAVLVWGAGLCCMYQVATSPMTLAGMMNYPRLTLVLVSAIVAGPVGWGILNRRTWAKLVVAWIDVAAVAYMIGWAIIHRSTFMFGVQLLAAWGAVRLFRWDITGQADWVQRMENIHKFLQRDAPPPVAPSSVTLEVTSAPPVTRESLAAAVEVAFGRKCRISLSNNNIDLGLEAACTTPETAIVGGIEGEAYGHLMVGANPIAIEIAWTSADGDGSQDGLPISVLSIGTPRQIRRGESITDGYDWTIPLAAALWTSKTRSATVDEESLSFDSAEKLVAWKTARLVSDN